MVNVLNVPGKARLEFVWIAYGLRMDESGRVAP
jgi:hypothetical protein